MKNILLFILCLMMIVPTFGQSSPPILVKKYVFEYDAAGNRILRYYDEVFTTASDTIYERGIDSLANDSVASTDTTGTSGARLINAEVPTQNALHIYPNPVTTVVYCKFDHAVNDPYQLLLFDSQGLLLQKIESQEQRLQIDMSRYALGEYRLLYMHGEEIDQWALVKVSK